MTAGLTEARPLLDEALDVLGNHFWSETDGLSADASSADFGDVDPYRGANANMHLTEAYLAAGDALGDDLYRERALSIARRLIDGHARQHLLLLQRDAELVVRLAQLRVEFVQAA